MRQFRDQGCANRPELRASHEDRDRAVEILHVEAGDGPLTAAELDKRVEAAPTARTIGELAALTADLPDAGGQAGSVAAQAKDVVRLDYQGGNAISTTWRNLRDQLSRRS